MSNIKPRLKTVMSKVFAKEDVSDELKLGEIEEWDSLRHFDLICEVEKEFKIRFQPSEIEQTTLSFKTLYATIVKKLDERGV